MRNFFRKAPVKSNKFLRKPILKNICGRLVLLTRLPKHFATLEVSWIVKSNSNCRSSAVSSKWGNSVGFFLRTSITSWIPWRLKCLPTKFLQNLFSLFLLQITNINPAKIIDISWTMTIRSAVISFSDFVCVAVTVEELYNKA